MSHELHLENKSKLTVTDVSSVDSFDEGAIFVNLKDEGLFIYGENLHVDALDLDEGRLIAAGKINSLEYTKKKEKKTLRERFRR